MRPDGRARLLLIDDDAFLLKAVARLLGSKATVVSANGGAEGLELLAADDDFDLVLCDHQMPGVDGAEFFRQAWELYPELRERFVVMSGDDAHPGLRPLTSRGIAVLAKPFATAEVFALIRAR